MFVDLNEAETASIDGASDICICGAGVAGIVLALALADRFRVILLEGGGMQISADSQRIYDGESVGRDYFDLAATRLRYFGGTSNHWGGWCRPLDVDDFLPRAYAELSGWPIGREDLDPFLERACDILDLGRPSNDDASPRDDVDRTIADSMDFKPIDFWWSAPTRFGPKYEEQIRSHPNIVCLLSANLVDIGLVEGRDAVDAFHVRGYSGNNLEVRASKFVLAAGGIENPRILLNCNSQIAAGIGNDAGLVGRFFAEHLHHRVGRFVVEDRVKAGLAPASEDWVDFRSAIRFFSPSREFMRQEEILNFGLRLVPSADIAETGLRSSLQDLICGIEVLESGAEWITGEEVPCFDGFLDIASEQALNPESRISLGSEADRFGMRRAVLDWQISPIDRRTMRVAALRFGEVLAQQDIGRLKVEDWILSEELDLPGLEADEVGGHHHMCSTRMAATPREGVVDSNQKVFGIDNLYIAGSSVFSTAGHANPTLTIVQMSLRLAGHLETSSG